MAKGRRIDKQRKVNFQWKSLRAYAQGAGITLLVAYLFYKSFLGIFAGIIILPFWIKLKGQEEEASYRAKLSTEFKEYMMLIVAGLQTGYSLERAIKQSEDELQKLYPNDSVLLPKVHLMNQKISMNMQLERAFDEFAKSIKLEEAISLAEIISFAKRSGGDYGKHIRQTALKIEDNLAIKQEIETITTEKRLELRVMCVMPLGILLYISLTSAGFIAPLYGNIAGVILMTVCLIVYGVLITIGRKIIDIKV